MASSCALVDEQIASDLGLSVVDLRELLHGIVVAGADDAQSGRGVD
jgi:hypothetical protein